MPASSTPRLDFGPGGFLLLQEVSYLDKRACFSGTDNNTNGRIGVAGTYYPIGLIGKSSVHCIAIGLQIADIHIPKSAFGLGRSITDSILGKTLISIISLITFNNIVFLNWYIGWKTSWDTLHTSSTNRSIGNLDCCGCREVNFRIWRNAQTTSKPIIQGPDYQDDDEESNNIRT